MQRHHTPKMKKRLKEYLITKQREVIYTRLLYGDASPSQLKLEFNEEQEVVGKSTIERILSSLNLIGILKKKMVNERQMYSVDWISWVRECLGEAGFNAVSEESLSGIVSHLKDHVIISFFYCLNTEEVMEVFLNHSLDEKDFNSDEGISKKQMIRFYLKNTKNTIADYPSFVVLFSASRLFKKFKDDSPLSQEDKIFISSILKKMNEILAASKIPNVPILTNDNLSESFKKFESIKQEIKKCVQNQIELDADELKKEGGKEK